MAHPSLVGPSEIAEELRGGGRLLSRLARREVTLSLSLRRVLVEACSSNTSRRDSDEGAMSNVRRRRARAEAVEGGLSESREGLTERMEEESFAEDREGEEVASSESTDARVED